METDLVTARGDTEPKSRFRQRRAGPQVSDVSRLGAPCIALLSGLGGLPFVDAAARWVLNSSGGDGGGGEVAETSPAVENRSRRGPG